MANRDIRKLFRCGIAILILDVERQPVFVRERRVQSDAEIIVVVWRRCDVAVILDDPAVARLREILEQSEERRG